ncbi:relaxin receptor 1, partial [Trichonephila clavipes]
DHNKINYFNNLFRKRPDEDREKENAGCELKPVPSVCRCSGFKLFCVRQNLEKPPPDLPSNVEELDLSENVLEFLDTKHFQLNEKLETLILKGSRVTLINKDAFKNLPHLKNLYLTNNEIGSMIEGTMATNNDLLFLDLSYNLITVLHPEAFIGLHNLETLDLRHCFLKSLPPGVFDSLVNLKKLYLDNNRLTSITKYVFQKLVNLEMLYISFNKIEKVHLTYWVGLEKLNTLAITENKISALEADSFGNMSSLYKMDVIGNNIKVISPDTFIGLSNLKSLTLQKNELKKATKAVFEPLTSLEYIYFDDFHMCSLALHVRVCEPRGDGISSIAHLLDSVVLRISVWLVAFVAGLGNVAVLVGRFLFVEPNEVHSFYIKNLSLADLLMSVYLFFIAAYDVVFRGEYIHHETKWRHSWQCNLCGFLSTLSSESSILILAVITTDSTSTESSRSISPLIDGTSRMTIDEPTDLYLPPSFELTLTLQEKVCRKRVLLTSRLTTMESGIDDIRNIINKYKENGHDASSFLIQDQLKIKEHFEKERQQLEFPPLPTPTQVKRKENSDGFANSPLRKITKTSRSNSTSELNFNIELANKFTSLDYLNIQFQPIADTTNLPHHPNIATTTNTVKPTPNTVNLPPPTMLKITDDLRNQMKILTTKMPYLRNKKAGQYVKLYTDTFDQRDALNAFLDNVKFPHYTITPKTQRPIEVVIKGLPRDTNPSDISNDLTDLGFSVDRVTQLKGNISKQLLPIFLITQPRNLTNAKIFDLKTLSYLSITVDGFNRKGATQCFKCNLFNHTAENCHLTPRCLNCGNEHQTRECQIVKVDSLFCINCETYGHLANYSKCSLYPKPRKDTITQITLLRLTASHASSERLHVSKFTSSIISDSSSTPVRKNYPRLYSDITDCLTN